METHSLRHVGLLLAYLLKETIVGVGKLPFYSCSHKMHCFESCLICTHSKFQKMFINGGVSLFLNIKELLNSFHTIRGPRKNNSLDEWNFASLTVSVDLFYCTVWVSCKSVQWWKRKICLPLFAQYPDGPLYVIGADQWPLWKGLLKWDFETESTLTSSHLFPSPRQPLAEGIFRWQIVPDGLLGQN